MPRQKRRNARRTRAPQFLAPVVTIAAAVLLTGCLSSGYSYISRRNPDGTELYFKLPASWKTYDSTQVIEAANSKLTYSQIKQIENGEWLLAFSQSPKFTLKQAGVNGATAPQGEAFARQLSPSERDTFALSSLRSAVLGFDPLAASTGVSVLDYTEFTAPGGLRASRLVVDLSAKTGPVGGLVTTFGQVVAVDPQTNWEFGIVVSCRASCWGPNQGLLNQILKSWTVKELR